MTDMRQPLKKCTAPITLQDMVGLVADMCELARPLPVSGHIFTAATYGPGLSAHCVPRHFNPSYSEERRFVINYNEYDNKWIVYDSFHWKKFSELSEEESAQWATAWMIHHGSSQD